MPTVSTDKIRNVALVGHGGAGKTTLAEALLHRAGAMTRRGRVEDGTTVSDHDPEEQRRGISLALSVLPFEWQGHKVNLIDTPGYADFVGEVTAALRVVDLAVLVVSAIDGVEVQTEAIWREAARLGVPRMVCITKLDRERASFERTLEQLRARLGAGVAPLELPIGAACLVGWSAGGLAALAAATVLGERALGVALVATVAPVEAYADDVVRSALGPSRRAFVEMASEVPRDELAAEVAPYLVPMPLTEEMALEHVLEGAGQRGAAELAAVPGAAEALARGLAGSVASGLAGLTADVARQLEPGLELSLVRARVRTFHGSDDPISPPEVGAWLVSRLPDAVLDLSPGAGHYLLFPRWAGILRALRRDVGR